MHQEIKNQWLAELRSGEFKQGKHLLTTVLPDGTEEDCCLGVLCKQAVKAGIAERVVREDGTVCYRAVNDHSDYGDSVLPGAARDWAGLPNCNPNVSFDGQPFALAELNDGLEKSFTEIADMIEQHL